MGKSDVVKDMDTKPIQGHSDNINRRRPIKCEIIDGHYPRGLKRTIWPCWSFKGAISISSSLTICSIRYFVSDNDMIFEHGRFHALAFDIFLRRPFKANNAPIPCFFLDPAHTTSADPIGVHRSNQDARFYISDLTT